MNLKVVNYNGEKIAVTVAFQFVVDELNKEYIVYTINDDGEGDVLLMISEIKEINGEKVLSLIPKSEKEQVLNFYKNIKNELLGE